MFQRMLWMMQRLQSMPMAEIPHRIREASRKQRDRIRLFQPVPLPQSVVERELPVLPFLVTAQVPLKWQQSIQHDAKILREEGVKLLNVQWPRQRLEEWSIDPISGQLWETQQAGHNIDFRHAHEGHDIKLAWELLKLQHLQILAWDAHLGDQDSADVLRNTFVSWLRHDQPFQGIAYASGIECGMRLVSMFVVCSLFRGFSEPERQQIWQSIYHHWVWVRRYPSLFSSANNHRMAELVAILLVEVMVPELPQADPQKTVQQIERLVQDVFHEDGVNTEQSLHYQALTMEWMLLANALTTHAGLCCQIRPTLAQSAVFLRAVMDKKGGFPAIGDGDNSVVMRQTMADENYILSLAGAACMATKQAVPMAYEKDLRGAMFAEHEIRSKETMTSSHFPQGGYTILRRHTVMLVFDHGPLGFPSTAGHGHADALSLWMHANGIPMWIDWGTFRYNGDERARRWARSTAAHNTIHVDGVSQSHMAGPFNWSRRAKSQLVGCALSRYWVEAEHDGYADRGLYHRRRIQLHENRIEITDRLFGEGEHQIGIRFLLAPCLQVEERQDGWKVYLGKQAIAIFRLKENTLQPKSYTAEDTMVGSFSPAYNLLQPTICLSWEGIVAVEQSFHLCWDWLISPDSLRST